MFDIEVSIASWRRRMVSGGIRPEALDELETHLREDFERRQAAGADGPAAFHAAIEAIGPPELLRREFQKLEPRAARIWSLVLFRACPLGMLLINGWTLLAYDISFWERVAGLIAIFAICLCLVRFPQLSLAWRLGAPNRLSKALKLAGALLFCWPILPLLDALGLVHLRLGIVADVVLWNLYGACAIIGGWNALILRFRGNGGSNGPMPPFAPGRNPLPPYPSQPPEFAPAPPASVDPVISPFVQAAGEEARRAGHDFIGTEHLLLGALQLAGASFIDFLQKLGVDSQTVRREIEKLVPAQVGVEGAARPLTPRARKAIKIALREARGREHPRFAPEHLFLGLLLEGSGVAAIVIRKLGVRPGQVLSEIHAS